MIIPYNLCPSSDDVQQNKPAYAGFHKIRGRLVCFIHFEIQSDAQLMERFQKLKILTLSLREKVSLSLLTHGTG